MRGWVWALCALLLVTGCDCDDGGGGADGAKKVAVSIFPLYDIARRVAGDRIEVVLVLPPGQSEHQYDPTPREMAALTGSDLGIAVGLELDGWVERIIQNATGDDVEIVQLGPSLDPRPMNAPEVGLVDEDHDDEDGDHDEGEEEHHHDEDGDHDEGEEHHHDEDGDHDEDEDEHHDEDGDHDEGEEEHHDEGEEEEHHAEEHHHHHHHGASDPHFWLDPVRMSDAVDLIVEAFSTLDPEGAEGFRTRGAEVKESLDALNDAIAERAEGWTKRSIVTMHGSFGYYADRYDLNIAAIVEPYPGREPTPRYMAEVLEAVEASDAAALFSEPQLDPRPARVISQEAGIELGELDPVGGSEGVDSYERLMNANTGVLDGLLR